LRIILVDPSEIFRMGLRALLADGGELVVCAEAGDAASALAAVRAHGPSLVVTELDLPDESGASLASAVREVAPTTRVLLLASVASDVGLRQAGATGIAGYVLKSQPARQILAAIHEAAAGRQVELPPLPLRESTRAEADLPRGRAAVLDRLSAREREIFDLIIWGQTNKQVAVKLGISVKTVETHRSHINGKLQVHSAAELVRLASLCGVLAAGQDEARNGSTDTTSTSTASSSRDKAPGKTAVDRSSLPRLVAKIG
jgi:two-component system, NarL family, response regulator NreC